MKNAELFEIFKGMFPDFAKCAKGSKLIGSKAISIEMENGKSLIFMYYGQDNWSFGTKVWRRKPDPTPKKPKDKKKAGVYGTAAE